ncbi:MAG: transglycosylase domain-containing protein, partial [Candidatus Cloacimonetes bacterium]|nr:transglycosylase domain-containing protein [Candidatus Cloacimonadota bacterium]
MDRFVYRYLFIFLAIIAIGFGVFCGAFYYYSDELPPLSELQNYDMKTGSEVYDCNNKLIHVFAVEKRKLTNINELPPHVILSAVAVEDKNFFNHWGVDLFALFRAFIIDITHGSFAQGASTITQQLSRNLFLSLDKQLPRKIKEFMLAVKIEKMYSKYEILEMYLNKVPYGPGIYGIEAAANKYFSKEARDLTVIEAATIVGLTQLPGAYYPYRYPERALRRRNQVLKRMFMENIISEKDYLTAIERDLGLVPPKGNETSASYFIEHIRKEIEPKVGTSQLFAGGLKIYTTLDIDLQNYADSILNEKMIEFEQKNEYEFKYTDFPADTIDIFTPYVQAGILSMEAATGYVKVMIGGRNFNHSKFNRITQSYRQPGSSFKPILYSTAID